MVTLMAKRGRPKETESGTRQVRVNDDLGEMIAWIVQVEGIGTARLLDPLLRDSIIARYESIKPAVEAIKKVMSQKAKTRPNGT